MAEALSVWCRENQIEPPFPGQIDRLLGTAIRLWEQEAFDAVHQRLPGGVVAALDELMAPGQRDVLARLRVDPGAIGVEAVFVELDKLAELEKQPPDVEAAAGKVEGAVGHLEAAIEDELFDDGIGVGTVRWTVATDRLLVLEVLADAVGGDSDKLEEAQEYLEEGDELAASGDYKDAAAAYKSAISSATGA